MEELGRASAGLAEDIDVILNPDWQAAEGKGKVRLFGFRESGFGIVRDEGTDLAIASGDLSDGILDNVARGNVTSGELTTEGAESLGSERKGKRKGKD